MITIITCLLCLRFALAQITAAFTPSDVECTKDGVRPVSLLQLRRKDAAAASDSVAFAEAQSSRGVDCQKDCSNERSTPHRSRSDKATPIHHSDALYHVRFLDSEFDDESLDDTLIMVPNLTLNHNPKCGGTFVKHVLSDSVPNTQVEWEFQALTRNETDSDFVIGMSRDPFTYYVSLWSYNSCVGGAFVAALTTEERSEVLAQPAHCEAGLGVDADDHMRFRKWLKLVNHPLVGLASMRFYFKYVANLDTGIHWGGETARRCLSDEGKCVESHINAEAMVQAFHQFEHRKDKICWVETKELVETTKACLLQFEKEGGRVDWTAFDSAVERDKHNASPHSITSDFYDDESIQSVLKQDRYLFEYFHFTPSPQD